MRVRQIAIILLAVIGVRTAVGEPSVSEIEIPLTRLPRELDGFTIVHISDVHLGRTVGPAFAGRTVRIANSLGADLISITGDLVDGNVDQLRDVAAPFGELNARHGVWLVTGNHEYYVGVDFWIEELNRMGGRFGPAVGCCGCCSRILQACTFTVMPTST